MSLSLPPEIKNALSSISKKTPLEPRKESLEKLLNLKKEEFKIHESYIVYELLDLVLKRFDDKPIIYDLTLSVGLHLVGLFSIQGFSSVLEIFESNLGIDSKSKIKL